MVERTFTPGALDHLDAAVKAKVNANNAKFGVHWLMSYANAEKTRTYCVYEGGAQGRRGQRPAGGRDHRSARDIAAAVSAARGTGRAAPARARS